MAWRGVPGQELFLDGGLEHGGLQKNPVAEAGSQEFQDDLQRLGGPLVQQYVGVGGVGGGDDVAHQGVDVHLALGDQAQEGLLEAFDGPAVRQLGRDAADLGADQLDPVVVELVAEAQADAVALVEAGGHHTRRRRRPSAAPRAGPGRHR